MQDNGQAKSNAYAHSCNACIVRHLRFNVDETRTLPKDPAVLKAFKTRSKLGFQLTYFDLIFLHFQKAYL